MGVKRVISKVKGAARKIKTQGKAALKTATKVPRAAAKILKEEGRAAVQVAKHGARSFGKLPLYKKAALVAAAPLAPLAYGASHGFRKPLKTLGVVKDIGVGAAKQIIGIPGRVAQFHKESIQEDWNAAKKSAGVKRK